ncbi:MAG: Edwardsiella phage [Pseudomonadota bacterium]
MINLRPDYQLPFVQEVAAALEQHGSVCGVQPTGSGKTVCFTALMHDRARPAAAVVHRKEIVAQISAALGRFEVRHRIIAPPAVVTRIRKRHLKEFGACYVDQRADTGVVSVQTLTSPSAAKNDELQRWLRQIDLTVFDEGHHYVKSGFWAKAVQATEHADQLFMTACPSRADGKGLGSHSDGFADAMVEGPTTQWLIDRGYLSKFKYYAPDSDLDASSLPVTASGEISKQALRQRVVESHLVGDVVDQWHRFAKGKQTIVFADSVATSNEIAAAFRAAGVKAEALDGATDDAIRDKAVDGFSDGSLTVLVNVDLFDEGFDVPGAECAILARPTESLNKYLQMCGRVLRIAKGKEFAIIIDPVRNWERLGTMPNWPQVWTLDGSKGSRGPSDTIPQRVCRDCTQPYERIYPMCPYCGAEPPPPPDRSAPDRVDGDLAELDVEAMAALFRRAAVAAMPPDEYARDQIRRGIPPIGRGADMKRHNAARHRQQVLHELVAYWVGMQPGRSLGEIHRRFYHRFGIDILTARTLNANDTDALIQKIQARFNEDLVL